MSIHFDKDKEIYYFLCPYNDCSSMIEVYKKDINCKIFRHGVYKESLKHIHPHTSKLDCESLKKRDKIYGCGKPFIFDGSKIEKCDYI